MRVLMATAGIGLIAVTVFVELRSSAGRDSFAERPSAAVRPVGTGQAIHWGWAKLALREFENRDLDGDGRLSRTELKLQDWEFEELDSDRDGHVSPRELGRYHRLHRRPG
ncbi:MAG: hypothetical protein CME06_11500 [Gemmatimonadetes bacterium]|nr:hypothetical protein [Gemmatimonadota bacterium]